MTMAVRVANTYSIFSLCSSPPLSVFRCRLKCSGPLQFRRNSRLAFRFPVFRSGELIIGCDGVRSYAVHSLVDSVMEELEAMRSRKRVHAAINIAEYEVANSVIRPTYMLTYESPNELIHLNLEEEAELKLFSEAAVLWLQWRRQQVRFTVLEDCLPLPEEKLRPVIKDNYYEKNKFDCQLKPEQVKNLCKLFQVTKRERGSKQVSRVGSLKCRTFLDRYRERRQVQGASHHAFDAVNQFPEDAALHERRLLASAALSPQLPAPLRSVHCHVLMPIRGYQMQVITGEMQSLSIAITGSWK